MDLRIGTHANRLIRLLLTAGLLLGLLLLGHYSGVTRDFDVERLREVVQNAGPVWLGLLIYLALFIVGLLLHIPGMIFAAAALVLWEGYLGYAIAFVSGLTAVSASFALVRFVGGEAFHNVQYAPIQSVMSHLEKHPVLSVILLRAAFWMSSPLNYALALTPIRFSHYLLGSAIGLLVPITIASLALNWFLL